LEEAVLNESFERLLLGCFSKKKIANFTTIFGKYPLGRPVQGKKKFFFFFRLKLGVQTVAILFKPWQFL